MCLPWARYLRRIVSCNCLNIFMMKVLYGLYIIEKNQGLERLDNLPKVAHLVRCAYFIALIYSVIPVSGRGVDEAR